MQKSEKFFIFSWKEILVLALVAITAIGFFFTLGLHYGKKLTSEFKPVETHVATLEQSPEAAPPRDTLEQGAHKAESEAGDAVHEATLKGLEENGMKVEHPKPVDLPDQKTVGKGAHEAKGESHDEAQVETKHESPKAEAEQIATKEEASSEDGDALPRFAIQLGSYPSSKEAQKKVSVFNKRGIKTEVRTAVVNGETRYRVVLPGFKSRKLAETKGKELKTSRKVENFVVIKSE
jgi:cell division protein FtsN